MRHSRRPHRPVLSGHPPAAGGRRRLRLADPDRRLRRRAGRLPRRLRSALHRGQRQIPTSAPTANSRYGLPGAHTLDAKDTYFGRLTGAEVGPADCFTDPDKTPNFIDDDFDDAVTGSLCPQAGGAGQVSLTLNVTMAATSVGGTRYINVLVDADHGGSWNDTPGVEWVVRDFPVYLVPGTSTPVTVGPFALPSSQVPMWTRIAVTDKEVVAVVPVNATGWDGSGQFLIGEIEDHLLTNYSALIVAAEADRDDAHDRGGGPGRGGHDRAEVSRADADDRLRAAPSQRFGHRRRSRRRSWRR